MNTVKKLAFQRLAAMASEIDRHRDDTVTTIRDAITILGDDLAPEIRHAFEAYCDGANALRGVGLALSRNEEDANAAAEEASKQASTLQPDASANPPMHRSHFVPPPIERNPWSANW